MPDYVGRQVKSTHRALLHVDAHRRANATNYHRITSCATKNCIEPPDAVNMNPSPQRVLATVLVQRHGDRRGHIVAVRKPVDRDFDDRVELVEHFVGDSLTFITYD